MLDLLAWFIAGILGATALLHTYWATGGVWPRKSQSELAATVVGTKGRDQMPGPRACLAAAIMIGISAVWPLMWRGLIDYPHSVPQTLIFLGMWVLAAVFLIRGLGGIVLPLSMTTPPFATLNRWIYSPLCIALGFGFYWLVRSP